MVRNYRYSIDISRYFLHRFTNIPCIDYFRIRLEDAGAKKFLSSHTLMSYPCRLYIVGWHFKGVCIVNQSITLAYIRQVGTYRIYDITTPSLIDYCNLRRKVCAVHPYTTHRVETEKKRARARRARKNVHRNAATGVKRGHVGGVGRCGVGAGAVA